MEGYLHKKEEGNRWVQYWAILHERLLKLHVYEDGGNLGNLGNHGNHSNSAEGLKLIGWIEITSESRCIQGKKKSSFYIEKQKRRWVHLSKKTRSNFVLLLLIFEISFKDGIKLLHLPSCFI